MFEIVWLFLVCIQLVSVSLGKDGADLSDQVDLGKLLKPEDICRMAGITRSALYRLISSGKFPKGFKVGKGQRWLPESVERHWEEQTRLANKGRRLG
jgi:predicted DNA-binding transcriptional regulator AlpA